MGTLANVIAEMRGWSLAQWLYFGVVLALPFTLSIGVDAMRREYGRDFPIVVLMILSTVASITVVLAAAVMLAGMTWRLIVG